MKTFFNTRIDGAMKEAIKEASHRLRMNGQQFGIFCLNLGLDAAGAGHRPADQPKPPSKLSIKLEEILESSDEDAKAGVRAAINLCHDRLRRPGAPVPVEVSPEVQPEGARKRLPLRRRRPA